MIECIEAGCNSLLAKICFWRAAVLCRTWCLSIGSTIQKQCKSEAAGGDSIKNVVDPLNFLESLLGNLSESAD
jgi:hypothetical protein